MKKESILALLLIISTVQGAIRVYLDMHHIHQPPWWFFGSTFIGVALIFAWYYIDSTLHSYKRTKLLNIGVVAIAVIAVPYYLVRSREKGQKGKALLKLAGFFILTLLCDTAGGLLARFIG